MHLPRFTRYGHAITHMRSHPHQPLGFVFGAALPLVLIALSWAHTTGGLAGPTPDPRPAAFTVQTD